MVIRGRHFSCECVSARHVFATRERRRGDIERHGVVYSWTVSRKQLVLRKNLPIPTFVNSAETPLTLPLCGLTSMNDTILLLLWLSIV